MTVSTTRNRRRLKQIGGKLLVLAFWLVLWQLAAFLVNQEILLVTPIQVAKTLLELFKNADFWQTVAGSLLRILSGLGVGLAAGILLAVLTANSRLVNYIFLCRLESLKPPRLRRLLYLRLFG